MTSTIFFNRDIWNISHILEKDRYKFKYVHSNLYHVVKSLCSNEHITKLAFHNYQMR